MATDDLTGRPWLLLPGTLCTSMVFDGVLEALGVGPDQCQTLLPDCPDISDYHDICARSGPDTVVCGFSLGAILAAHWADRLTAHRLVLFDLNPFADDPSKAKGRHDLAHDVATLGGAEAMASRLPPLSGATPDLARATILEMADHTAHLIDAQTQLALSRPGALKALSQARMPVLSLTGSEDTAAPPAQGRAAADAAPNGQFSPLAGLGHFALLEDPKACAVALTRMNDAIHDPIPT